MKMPTQARLRELLTYDPETGIFVWKKKRRAVLVGAECGRLNAHGYREICVDYRLHHAHRLAWVYMTGAPPERHIDHIDRDRQNNAWANLRACNPSENAANTTVRANSESGIKGVHYDAARGKWCAQIRVEGRKRNLGRFDDAETAAQAYQRAASAAFGEFAA